MIQAMPATAHPMQALQASLAGLGMVSPKTDLRDAASKDEACRRVIACTPVLVAAFERVRAGKEYVAPKADLSTAANFLWCLDGEAPDDVAVRTLDCALILHAEHTMNASTFACRSCRPRTTPTPCSAPSGRCSGRSTAGRTSASSSSSRPSGRRTRSSVVRRQVREQQKVMGTACVYKTKDPGPRTCRPSRPSFQTSRCRSTTSPSSSRRS